MGSKLLLRQAPLFWFQALQQNKGVHKLLTSWDVSICILGREHLLEHIWTWNASQIHKRWNECVFYNNMLHYCSNYQALIKQLFKSKAPTQSSQFTSVLFRFSLCKSEQYVQNSNIFGVFHPFPVIPFSSTGEVTTWGGFIVYKTFFFFYITFTFSHSFLYEHQHEKPVKMRSYV